MGSEGFWEIVENSSAENRKLAEVIRQLEGLHGGHSPVHWEGSGSRCSEILREFFQGSEESQILADRLSGREYEVGGDEHHLVQVEAVPERVFKITHCNAFGCFSRFSPHDPELTGRHFHGTVNEDPIFYLRRWMLLNYIGEYQTRFEGILPPQNGLSIPRICVSQPVVENSNPSETEIRECLRPYGYMRVSADAFVNFETGILLTDAAPRNVRIVDGIPVLFDVIASLATSMVREWAVGILPKAD